MSPELQIELQDGRGEGKFGHANSSVYRDKIRDNKTQGATLRSAPTGPTGADRLPHHIFDDKIDKIDSSLSYLIHYLFSTP